MGNFYVVSKVSEDADDYESALVFNETHPDADNEAAANDYMTEAKTLRPWQHHSVVSAEDFDAAYPDPDSVSQPSPNLGPDEPIDPLPQSDLTEPSPQQMAAIENSEATNPVASDPAADRG